MLIDWSKALVISPQGYLGCRISVLAAGILLSELSGRVLYCHWPREEPVAGDIPEVAVIRDLGLDHFFEPIPGLFTCPSDGSMKVDLVYAQWLPGFYWHRVECSARTLLKADDPKFVPTLAMPDQSQFADSILGTGAPVVLIETSIPFRVSAYDESTWRSMLSRAFARHFKPKTRFMDAISHVPQADLGIGIRDGVITSYFGKPMPDRTTLQTWIAELQSSGVKVLIVNMDSEVMYQDKKVVFTAPEKEFLNFLILATRCRMVSGHEDDVLVKTASVYGSCPFLPLLGKIPGR